MPPSIVVRAPATSANLGPGFDCLGMALDLWNEVEAVPCESAAVRDAADEDNLILRSARAVFDLVGTPYPGFELRCINRIPFGRGLGSSAAAIASGVLFANHCLGTPLDEPAVLQLATDLEGHPDNVVPCLLGGVRVATRGDRGNVLQTRVPLAIPLQTVIFVPEQTSPTAHARGLLPDRVSMADALFNLSRSSLLVAALSAGRPELLAEATRDRLHQPYRLALFPAAASLLQAGLKAGALGVFTSGAGPSVLALCASDAQADSVFRAFEDTAQHLGLVGASQRLGLSQSGASVVR